MTTKVNEVVIDALEDLIVQSEEASIEPPESNAAIRILNNLMTAWDSDGISLGYTIVQDMGDIMTVPDGAIRGIKANLAVELAPKYDVPVTPAMVKKATEGKRTCINIAIEVTNSEFPSTLPQGSGNSETFYPDQESTILTESGGSIALEEDTND